MGKMLGSIWLHRRRRDLNVISKNLSKNLEEFNLYSNEYQLNPELLKERLSSSKFLHRFRTAQKERNMRITKWAKLNPTTAFTLDGTMMDPRWIFPTIDPNDRIQSWDSYLGDPRVANDIPTGLARFSTGLSWLSQWSLEESKGDAVHHMTNVTVPTLVVENGADNGCPRPHMEEMFASCASEDKKYVCICNAFHYFQGQKDKLEEAACTVVDWLMERELFLQSGEEKVVEEVEEVCSLPGPPVVSSFLHPNVFGFLAQNSATVRPSAQDMQSAVIALQQMGASPRVLASLGLVVAAPP